MGDTAWYQQNRARTRAGVTASDSELNQVAATFREAGYDNVGRYLELLTTANNTSNELAEAADALAFITNADTLVNLAEDPDFFGGLLRTYEARLDVPMQAGRMYDQFPDLGRLMNDTAMGVVRRKLRAGDDLTSMELDSLQRTATIADRVPPETLAANISPELYGSDYGPAYAYAQAYNAQRIINRYDLPGQRDIPANYSLPAVFTPLSRAYEQQRATRLAALGR